MCTFWSNCMHQSAAVIGFSPSQWQSSSFARPRPLSTTAPHVREHIDSPTIMDGAPLCPRSHVPHAALSAFLIPLTRAPRSCTVTAASATAIEAPWTCRYLISGCKVSALPGPPCPAMPSTFVHVLLAVSALCVFTLCPFGRVCLPAGPNRRQLCAPCGRGRARAVPARRLQ